jgi:hypothetical protein
MIRVIGGDQQAAYSAGGAYKPGHAVTMHAVLVLPLLARLLAATGWSELRRVRLVWLGVAGYALLAGVVIAETLASIDPFSGPLAGTVIAGLGLLMLAAAGAVTLAGLVRRSAGGPIVDARSPRVVGGRG